MSVRDPARSYRLILDTCVREPAWNLALEEAILSTQSFQPTLRLWVNPPSVVLGVNQDLSRYVNLGFCEARGIAVNRRVTGGGTIYMDEGNLNWSFFAPSVSPPASPSQLYSIFGGVVARALRRLGYEVAFASPNRIDHEGRKVSGMAAYIKRDRVLVHGTLLVHADLSALREAIRIHTSPVPVANLDATRRVKEFANRLIEALGSLGLGFESSPLTMEEITIARRLMEGKYRLLTWVWEGSAGH
jgi:lipoate-protein ligase A